MISREALRELAAFESPEQGAISFYFQPRTPRNLAHREEAILIKDVVRDAQRRSERNGQGASNNDLRRILELAERLNGNHSRAKAVFACEAKKLWREFDLPPELERTALTVNRRLHLKPLAVLMEVPRCAVALVDRKRARIFEIWLDEIAEVDDVVGPAPRAGRSDGFKGYDAGHVERHIDNFTLRHYQNVCERLLRRYARGRAGHSAEGFQKLLLGCREENRAELEGQLHPYLRQALLGWFSLDVATATPDQVRAGAERRLREQDEARRQGLLREVLGEAQRNGRGALGLRRVLTALERGEVQAVLLDDRLEATVAECTKCGHLDTRMVRECAVCGQKTRELEDVADAIISHALRNSAELVHVGRDEEFQRAGGVGALLRFRADQNTEARRQAS